MDCVMVPSDDNDRNRVYNKFKDDYKLDLWLELKKRWLIVGVLISILLAVVSPRVGAPGGPLYPEYLSLGPLSYIYFSSGRRARPPASLWAGVSACALTATHAHVVAPALCAVAAASAADAGLHSMLVKGALLSSAGGPCAWLSLSAARDAGTAALCLAASHLAAAPAAPAALYIICGRAPLPALGPSIWSALCILPPFFGGVLYTHVLHKNAADTETLQLCTETLCVEGCNQLCRQPCVVSARLCALVLVYFDCCERLREAEGALHVGDVLGTLVFAVVYVCLSAGAWLAYAYGGLARSGSARTLAACAVPKAMLTGWEVSSACVAGGLARLPAVLVAPAQALLVAAIAEHQPLHTYHALPR